MSGVRNGGGHRAKFFVGRCTACWTYYVAADPGCPRRCDRDGCRAPVAWKPQRQKIQTPEYVVLPGPPMEEKEPWLRSG